MNASTGYRSTTDEAATLRADLKRNGWTSRQVSVRADYYSMGSAIRVHIKDPSVPLATVKRLAEEHESIRRDGFGEILSGGNRYVSVDYAREALDIIASRFLEAVQRAADAVAEGSNSLEPVQGAAGFMIGKPRAGVLSVWNDDGHQGEAWSAKDAAEIIGCRLVKAVRS